ncbi:MAG TPA: hypothetical protein PKL84_09065, partial [Candidatus Hydrogenedentes bacterium]|nr:hypothetical protein [Candidatus Hydrogenedentota bacterium]
TAGIIISAAATEMAGYLKPNPVVTGITHILADTTDPRAPLQYRVQVTVSNEGRRACRLNPRALSSPDPVSYRVARHTAGNDWDYEIYPIRVKTGGEDWRDLAGAAGEAVLHPGDEGIFEYVLGPGDYRVELHPRWLREGQTRMFTLERGQTPPEDASVDDVPGGETPTFPEYVPAPAPDQDPMPAPDDSLPPEDTPAPAAPSRASGPELELRGIGSDPVGGPRFVLMLHHRDGRSHAFRVGLGERVFRAWSATEYDPQRQTLTIGLLDDEGRVTDVRILHTGERVALPMSEPPQAP